MARRILVSGLLGAIVLVAWTVVVNAVFGFAARMDMNPVPNERAVYALLEEQIAQPGAYLANPAPSANGEFPPGEPVYGIRYGGVGHEAAGRLLVIDLLTALVASIVVAGLLSVSSTRILSRYAYRVLYVASIGFLLAVFGDVPKYGIGGYPARDALLLAANHVVSWTLAGAAMAWGMRAPGNASSAGAHGA